MLLPNTKSSFIASLHALINYFGMRSSTLSIKSIAEDGELTNVLFNVGILFFIDSIILFMFIYLLKKECK
jgi:hypothetical protein